VKAREPDAQRALVDAKRVRDELAADVAKLVDAFKSATEKNHGSELSTREQEKAISALGFGRRRLAGGNRGVSAAETALAADRALDAKDTLVEFGIIATRGHLLDKLQREILGCARLDGQDKIPDAMTLSDVALAGAEKAAEKARRELLRHRRAIHAALLEHGQAVTAVNAAHVTLGQRPTAKTCDEYVVNAAIAVEAFAIAHPVEFDVDELAEVLARGGVSRPVFYRQHIRGRDSFLEYARAALRSGDAEQALEQVRLAHRTEQQIAEEDRRRVVADEYHASRRLGAAQLGLA